MIKYILKRLFSLIPLLLGISMLVFLLMYIAPGDFLSQARNSKDISPEVVRQQEIQLGLDKPWYVQYGRWLNSVSPVKTSLLLPEGEKAGILSFTSERPTSGIRGATKFPFQSFWGRGLFRRFCYLS